MVTIHSKNTMISNKKMDLIKFKDNSFELDVRADPINETVWLSLLDISNLFGRDKSVILRHIKNIYREKELDENTTVAKNAQVQIEGSREVTRIIDLYNLDVIISVGYRVKSKRGVLFRKWANNILKEYLLRGYLVNEKRALVTNENYINLINKVDSIDRRVSSLKQNDSYNLPIEKVIYDNTVFDSLVLIDKLVSSADDSIVLIDPYCDIKTLNALKGKRKQVHLYIITSNRNKISSVDIASFNDEYGNLSINIDNQFHDRYLILDRRTFYHLGTSINYLGRKFIVFKTKDDNE